MLTEICIREVSVMTRLPLNQTTSGGGSPEMEQLKRTVCPTRHRFGRSFAVKVGAVSNLENKN